jgi:hypothetical protein
MDSIIDLLRQLPDYEAQILVWELENIQIADHRAFLQNTPAIPARSIYENIHRPGMMRLFHGMGVVDIPMQWLEQEIYPYFNRVCDAYPAARSKLRAGVRQAFAMHDVVLLMLGSYTHYASTQIHAGDDIHWLQRGLAGVAIMDSVQTNQMLGDLYLSAYQAQIDPDAYFEAAAKLCSAEPRKYGVDNLSMRDFVAGFKDSEYFRRHIAPKL